jgi:hypothetical protein
MINYVDAEKQKHAAQLAADYADAPRHRVTASPCLRVFLSGGLISNGRS